MWYSSDSGREELEIEANGRDDYNREAYGDTVIPGGWDDDDYTDNARTL